jgi:hypothetical protein
MVPFRNNGWFLPEYLGLAMVSWTAKLEHQLPTLKQVANLGIGSVFNHFSQWKPNLLSPFFLLYRIQQLPLHLVFWIIIFKYFYIANFSVSW